MPTATPARSINRRRNFRRRRPNPAKKVQEWELTRLRKQVKRMMPKLERKVDDSPSTPLVVTTTASITNILSPAQGTGDDDRIGDRVNAKSLFIRLSITPNATAGMNFLRFIVLRDKQGNGAAPSAANVLSASTDYQSPINEDYGQRFKVLFDRTYTVDNDANGAQVDKIYRKLNFRTVWPDEGSTWPNTNSLLVFMISDQATNGPTVQYYARVRFTDG